MNLNHNNVTQLKLELTKQLCIESFHFFVKTFWHIADGSNFIDNWHIKYICDTLQEVEKGNIQNAYICVPPGSAKSMIVSVMYPVWVWLRDPTKSFLSTGHTQNLNQKFCEKSLRFMYQPEFMNMFPEIQMDPIAKAKAHYRNLNGGFRQAVSFGGLTGNRANYVLVDDPITVNDAKNSKTERDNVNDIFLNALQSRVNDPEKDHIIVIAQRTHVNDIVGIIQENNMNYEGVIIPMEYCGNKMISEKLGLIDPREIMGELMFPKRFSKQVVDNYKSTMLNTDYATQYQQTPLSNDGNFFDITKLNKWSSLPSNMNVYISTDNAITGNGDYNAIMVWGIDHMSNYYLIDYFHEKCTLLETLGLDDNNHLKQKGLLPFIKKYNPICIFPENDNAFKTIETIIKQKMIEHKIISAIKPIPTHGGNKIAKAQGLQLAIEQGKVYMPTFLSNEIVDELNHFPLSKHDDAIDSMANFFRSFDIHKVHYMKKETVKSYDYMDDEDNGYSMYG